jgi:hypothetical protein
VCERSVRRIDDPKEQEVETLRHGTVEGRGGIGEQIRRGVVGAAPRQEEIVVPEVSERERRRRQRDREDRGKEPEPRRLAGVGVADD